MFFAQKVLYEKANGTYVDKREKAPETVTEFGFYRYENCDAKRGDVCRFPRCVESIMIFKNNESIYFKCGREDKK